MRKAGTEGQWSDFLDAECLDNTIVLRSEYNHIIS